MIHDSWPEIELGYIFFLTLFEWTTGQLTLHAGNERGLPREDWRTWNPDHFPFGYSLPRCDSSSKFSRFSKFSKFSKFSIVFGPFEVNLVP